MTDRTDVHTDRTAVQTGLSSTDQFANQAGNGPVQVARVVRMNIMNALDLSKEFEKDTGISASLLLPELKRALTDATVTDKGLSECLIKELNHLFTLFPSYADFQQGFTHAFVLSLRTALSVADRELHDEWIELFLGFTEEEYQAIYGGTRAQPPQAREN